MDKAKILEVPKWNQSDLIRTEQQGRKKIQKNRNWKKESGSVQVCWEDPQKENAEWGKRRRRHQGIFADLSWCDTNLSRACSIRIHSWWSPFLLHKDGFPPLPAPGWLDMTTFHVVVFPNWWLNDFFPLPIIISWRNEAQCPLKTLTIQRREPWLALCYRFRAVLLTKCNLNFKIHWFGQKKCTA